MPKSIWISNPVSGMPFGLASVTAYASDRRLWLPNAARTSPWWSCKSRTQRS